MKNDKEIKLILIIISVCFCALSLEANIQIKETVLTEICSITYPATTQAGKLEAQLSVCELTSKLGYDTSLYIVKSFEKEYPVSIDHILPGSICPVIERRGNEIHILYTRGVNTTCVTVYSIESGVAHFRSTESIAWNDNGTYRTSDNYYKYENLLKER